MSDFGASAPPKLSLAMLARLSDSSARRDELDPRPLVEEDHLSQVAFTTTRERALVALGLYTLHNLSRAGASRIDHAFITQTLERLWPSLSRAERIEIEIEAYDMLEHLGNTLDPKLATSQHPPEQVSPSSTHEQVARWAIHHARDLRLEFYDSHAGKLISHHITPMSLDAGTYLRAISHTTCEERVFSIKRLGSLAPLDGWTMHHEEGPGPDFWDAPPPRTSIPPRKTAPTPPTKPSRQQMSWLDEVPAPHEEE